jgi:hypothetical protein
MKKLLLASALAIASFPGYAHAESPPTREWCKEQLDDQDPETPREMECLKLYGKPPYPSIPREEADPPARVTVAPPYQGPPPIGWVYGPYTQCGNPPQCSMGVVSVDASGLNVRIVPNGPPVMSLVNGTPLIPLQKQGDWLLVAPACDLTPTWAWSWNAGVPLNRCWVYF